jgi:prenyltransferase beta subunit
MSRRLSLVVIAVVVLIGAVATAAAHRARARTGSPADAPAAFDRTRTLEYLQGWARRDRYEKFPESPAFAYYNLWATRALGGDVAPELRAQVVDYLRRCQAADGGFTMAPATGDSHVVPTFHAVRTLELLGALDAIDRPRASAFLAALARPGGGYAGRAAEAAPSLGTTYHALAALDVLGERARLDRAGAAAFVASHRAADGAFGLAPGAASSPAATFMAVRTLKLLGALDAGTAEVVAAWLGASRYAGRRQDAGAATPPELEDAAYVLAALEDVARLDLADRARVERFVTSLYVPENGGFGPQPGLGTTPPSTYHAIACLVTVGALPVPARG